jgi:Phosphodiester glycosidase
MQRFCLRTLLLILALPAICRAAVTTTYPFQGVTLIHRTETSPRPLDIHVAIIDMLAPGVRFQASPESPHANDLTVAQTTRSFINGIGAQLGINGDFYSSPGTVNGITHRDPSNFAASLGNIYSPFTSGRPAIHVAKNNVAHTVTGSNGSITPSPTVAVWNAVGGSDYLINNGTIPAYMFDPAHGRYAFANELHPRTAFGISADRSKVAMFVVDGRQSDSGGMNFPEMANMLRNDYGMHWAINLDGGGSTTMAIRDPNSRVLNDPSDGSERAVANSLALFARPTPAAVPGNARTLAYSQEVGGYSHTGTQILSNDPNSSSIGGAAIRVGYDTAVGKSRGVLSFDFSGLPSDATIHSISLTVDAFATTGTASRYVDMELYQLTDPVHEEQVTWNQAAVGNNWTTPGGDVAATTLSSLYAQQTIGLKTFVSTQAFVTAANAAFDAGQPLNLLIAAPETEVWGAANNSNLNLRFRSDDATTGVRPTLTVQFTSAFAPGDFNQDHVVDAADYVAWRKNAGAELPFNYNTWRQSFASSAHGGAGAAVAPEPATWVMCTTITMALTSWRRSRQSV